MTGRAIGKAAARAAEVVVGMVAPALLPHEQRDFYRKTYGLLREFAEALRRQGGRDLLRRIRKPNLN